MHKQEGDNVKTASFHAYEIDFNTYVGCHEKPKLLVRLLPLHTTHQFYVCQLWFFEARSTANEIDFNRHVGCHERPNLLVRLLLLLHSSFMFDSYDLLQHALPQMNLIDSVAEAVGTNFRSSHLPFAELNFWYPKFQL